ncbi:MAG: undecaprenyl/decaprenyl-phosphate alpha-N-acetylglucosaminyl 1-phosphate transferase [Planctomycetota bacterium]|nr:undecaprenyl/decaprenyl-phosphate alpha-N-acetylglucosaminyl 1-phosphate transferase [Planctomycetota bacterium]
MTLPLFIAACLLPAFLLSLALTAAMRMLSPRLGLIDKPAARKVHLTPTPLGGGVAVWAAVVGPILGAVLVAWLIRQNVLPTSLVPAALGIHIDGMVAKAPQLFAILGAGTLLAAVGLYDDFRAIPWQPRLALQFLAAGIVVGAGVRATLFVSLPWFGSFVTVFWIVLLVNAFNFLDNMNGLSGGIAFVAAGVLAAIMLTALSEPRWFVAGTMLILAGSLGGFLTHNWRGRIFMGDAGSYFVGLLMASLTAAATFYETEQGSRHVLLAPLCVLAVPLYDFTSVMVIRLSQRRSPFQPDKSHFSHRLVELGLSPPRAVLTIYLATLTTGLAALVLYQVPGWGGAWLVIVIVGCVLAIVAILETTGRRSGRRLTASQHSAALTAALDHAPSRPPEPTRS